VSSIEGDNITVFWGRTQVSERNYNSVLFFIINGLAQKPQGRSHSTGNIKNKQITNYKKNT
jgi:hypothetical protein